MAKQIRMLNGQLATVAGVLKTEQPSELIVKEKNIVSGIFGPFFGEMGWMVMRHVRFVHAYPCREKIVICMKGEEGLFPSASHFYTLEHNPIPDSQRGDDSDAAARAAKVPILNLVQAMYPDAVIVETPFQGTLLQSAPKFVPRIKVPVLDRADVVICARRRTHIPQRNWGLSRWHDLVHFLNCAGISVGVIGLSDSSEQLPDFVIRGWSHPSGPMAGALELLSRCSLYVGTDTGISHLAALMNVPMILFHHNDIPGQCKMVNEIRMGTSGPLVDMGVTGWNNPSLLLTTILATLGANDAVLPL